MNHTHLRHLLLVTPDEALCCEVGKPALVAGFSVAWERDRGRAIDRIRRDLPGTVLLDARGDDKVIRDVSGLSLSAAILVLVGEDGGEARDAFGDRRCVAASEGGKVLVQHLLAVCHETSERGLAREALLQAGALQLDRAVRTARYDGRPLSLTWVEFDLLCCLVSRAGEPVSRDELQARALGDSAGTGGRSIDVHISHLRRKLAEVGLPSTTLRSVRSVGYVLVV